MKFFIPNSEDYSAKYQFDPDDYLNLSTSSLRSLALLVLKMRPAVFADSPNFFNIYFFCCNHY